MAVLAAAMLALATVPAHASLTLPGTVTLTAAGLVMAYLERRRLPC